MAAEEEVVESDESLIALTTHFAQVKLLASHPASCAVRVSGVNQP